MLKPLTAFLCFLMLMMQAAIAQNVVDLKIKTFTVNDGLIHNKVNKTVMDANGFLWIATEGGLSRFDGVNFTNFRKGFPNLNIQNIAIDAKQNLWMSGPKGIFYLHIPTQKITQFEDLKTKDQVFAFALDSARKCTWFVNERLHKLCKIDWNTKIVESYSTDIKREIIDIICFDNKVFLAEERRGIIEFFPSSKKIKQHYKNIWPIRFEVINTQLWASTWQDDLYKYQPETDSFYAFILDDKTSPRISKYIVRGISEIRAKDKSFFLLGFNSGVGLGIYDVNKQEVVQEIDRNFYTKNTLNTKFVDHIFKDHFGNVWLSTWDGLGFINFSDQQFLSKELAYLDTKNYNAVVGIARDKKEKENIWIAATGSGVAKVREKNQLPIQEFFNATFKESDPDYDYRWTSFLQIDEENRVWSGGYTGLVKVENNKRFIYDFYPNSMYAFVMNLHRASPDSFWVSTMQRGLVFFNPKTAKYHNYDTVNSKIGSNAVLKVIPKTSNQLWVCTDQNLHIYHIDKQEFESFPLIYQGGKLADLTNFELDNQGNIYISNSQGTYYKAKNSQEFEVITSENNPIVPAFQNCILADKNANIWIYSTFGLYSFNPQTKALNHFTQKDGLYNANSDPARLFEFEDDFYVGYRMAYTKFNPLLVNQDSSKPKPVIIGLRLLNNPVQVPFKEFETKPYAISYKNKVIEISFTAINYTHAEKTKFFYKLEGFDKDWRAVSNKRFATYTNLPGGKYTFKVKAINSKGISSASYAELQLQIIPPFWETWWFKILVVLVILGIFYLAYRIRINNIRKAEKLKTAYNKKVAELESTALRSQMNPHFVFNSLNSIQNFIAKNDLESSSRYLSKFAKLTRLIFEHSKQQFITLTQEFTALNAYVTLEQLRFQNSFEFEILVDPELNQDQVEIPPMLLQPFVENAIWHGIMHKTDGFGKISVKISRNKPNIQIEIVDNGIGRKKSESHKKLNTSNHQSRGVMLTKERLDLLNTQNNLEITCEIIDLYNDLSEPLGTKVLIVIPEN